jgi:hypothetical protein
MAGVFIAAQHQLIIQRVVDIGRCAWVIPYAEVIFRLGFKQIHVPEECGAHRLAQAIALRPSVIHPKLVRVNPDRLGDLSK